jgi:Outer membrane protein beta-barrel domain
MRFSSLAILAGSAISSLPTVAAPQNTTTLSIAAGQSMPIARFKDSHSSGFAGAIGVIFGSDNTPFGLQIDAGYDKLRARTTSSAVGSNERIISGTANVLFTFPGTSAKPYLSGGLGEYGMKSDTVGAKTLTNFGFNFGSGISFPLSSRSALLEARLQSISQKNAKPLRYLQVLFGILL